MSDVLYLAWRYLAHHRGKTVILVASIALIGFLPLGLRVLVDQSAAQLTSRAAQTPLVVGARGSPVELTLSSLYFETEAPPPMHHGEVDRVRDSGLASGIPLHLGFRAGGHPIVGTSLAYFDFRGLSFASGRAMATLGECVLGARVARALAVGPGDAVVSSPVSAFDIAGIYPLKMRVAGVLAPSDSPDDLAVFVDVKTAWVIEGVGHGHQDLAKPEAAAAVLERSGSAITANASVRQYNEITPENAASFHFHGDLAEHAVHAILVVPDSAKSRVRLLGRYAGAEGAVQMVDPGAVMDELLDTVVTLRSFAIAGILGVSTATLATAALVFALSVRLRRREIETLVKIGGAPGRVAAMLLSEAVLVFAAGAAIAGGLTWLTSLFGAEAIRVFLRS